MGIFKKKWAWLSGGVLFVGLLLSGCGSSSKSLIRNNEIITYEAPISGKEIVRIGFSMNMDWKPLIATLNEKFPDKQFIYDFDATSGINLPLETVGSIVKKNDYDFVVANYWNAPSLGADISGEAFLDNYLQTTLSAISSDGHVYGIPLPTSTSGLYYNKTLFAQKGWSMPTSSADLISLCHTIKAAGISPFGGCFKYESQLCRVLEGMLYDQLFSSSEGMAWYADLIAGKKSFADYATPMFETAKQMLDEGVFSLDGFSASLTTMRKNFFAGKIAMMDYSSDIYSLASSEGCNFDVGLAPYPSTTGKNSPVLYGSSAVLYIPSSIKADSKRYAFDTSVMDYLSTSEGQDALLTGWTGVPSTKNYQGSSLLYQEVANYIKQGTYHSVFDFAPSQDLVKPLETLVKNSVLAIGNGTSVSDAIATLDTSYAKTLVDGVPTTSYEKIASASDDFTTLETSYYLADKIKAATSAEIALVPSGGFYRSNMGYFSKGDITNDTRLFYEKGVGSKDYITVYRLTGVQLRDELEHPYINSIEQNQFVAASGLNVEYAPWHASGNRVVKVSFEDGTALEDERTYQVACYAGVLDARYITETGSVHSELKDPQSFIEASLRADGEISPNIASRVKLDWDIQA